MANNNQKGLFITFEGIDGCGKTTQIELLDKYLKEKNLETVLTREPGGSDIGKNLRQILLHYDKPVDNVCEMLLYLADRAQHVEYVILKNKNEGKVVLCDRHIDSTVAYQGYARGGNIAQINQLNAIATKNTLPDLTFVFDIDVKLGQKRVGATKDRLEQEGLEFFEKVRQGYLQLANKYPNRIKVIDASKSIDEVFLEVKKIIDEVL